MPTIHSNYGAFVAGGNLGGDLDHLARPVLDGMIYVTRETEKDGEVVVAGPFASPEDAAGEILHLEVAAALESRDYERLRDAAFLLILHQRPDLIPATRGGAS